MKREMSASLDLRQIAQTWDAKWAKAFAFKRHEIWGKAVHRLKHRRPQNECMTQALQSSPLEMRYLYTL